MSLNIAAREKGVIILRDDAILTEKNPHKTELRAWDGVVEIEGDDLHQRFGRTDIAFGTKSCLAQLGIFAAVKHRGKTAYPDIEVTKKGLVAKIQAGNYSDYPVQVEEGDPVGRFFRMEGSHLSKHDVEQEIERFRDEGKRIFVYQDKSLAPDGSIVLNARSKRFVLNPDTEAEHPYKVTSRRHLPALQKEEKLSKSYEMKQGEFLVTDTPHLEIPDGLAGLLLVDQLGDMAAPAHLNSPIVDPGYSGNLRLELFQPHPYPKKLEDVFVRLYIFRARVIDAIHQREFAINPDKKGKKNVA